MPHNLSPETPRLALPLHLSAATDTAELTSSAASSSRPTSYTLSHIHTIHSPRWMRRVRNRCHTRRKNSCLNRHRHRTGRAGRQNRVHIGIKRWINSAREHRRVLEHRARFELATGASIFLYAYVCSGNIWSFRVHVVVTDGYDTHVDEQCIVTSAVEPQIP
jgi:hypothetical protein